MSLHAVDDVDDAITATKELLLPFEWRRWLRFAVVALFLGGSAGFPSIGGQWSTEMNGVTPTHVPERALLVVLVVAAVVLLFGLAFAAVGALMEFVLFEALATRTLEIRAAMGRHAGKGLRLFVFRAVFWLAVVLPVLAFVAVAVLFPPLFVLLLLLIPVALLLFALAAVVNAFTTMFVVPIMLREDCGVLAGWRRLWPELRTNLTEFGAYAVLGFVLNVATGFLVGVVAVVVGLLLAIPFLLVFGVPIVVFALSDLFVLAALVVGGGLYALVMLAVLAYVQVPVQTFHRYYAVLVLGDIVPSLDPIEAVRRDIRTDGAGDTELPSAADIGAGRDDSDGDDADGVGDDRNDGDDVDGNDADRPR